MTDSKASANADDSRFTIGLYVDVIAVLEKHGYVRAPGKKIGADVLVTLLHMVREFEGRAECCDAPGLCNHTDQANNR